MQNANSAFMKRIQLVEKLRPASFKEIFGQTYSIEPKDFSIHLVKNQTPLSLGGPRGSGNAPIARKSRCETNSKLIFKIYLWKYAQHI